MDLGFLPANIWEVLLRIFLIALSSLGVVYMISRMLFITHSPFIKNIIAIVSMFFMSFLFLIGDHPNYIENGFKTFFDIDKKLLIDFIVDWVFYFLTSIVVYVLLGFRLYSRVDTLLDHKIGKDCAPSEVKEYEEKLSKKHRKKGDSK